MRCCGGSLIGVTTAVVGIAGCTLGPWDPVSESGQMSAETYARTHSRFDSEWVGYSVDDLIAARGEPDEIYHAIPMGSTFDHGVHIDSYVYGLYDRGPCVDAYVVVEETGQIVRYHCR